MVIPGIGIWIEVQKGRTVVHSEAAGIEVQGTFKKEVLVEQEAGITNDIIVNEVFHGVYNRSTKVIVALKRVIVDIV